MPRTLSILLSLAAATLSMAAARPAATQAPRYARPAKPGVTVVDDAVVDSVVHAIAHYRFVPRRGLDMPAQVTVADSAGVLVASYRLAGSRTASPVTVAVFDTDLVLQGETPSGILTLVLLQQNDPAPGDVSVGHWSLGDQFGELGARPAL